MGGKEPAFTFSKKALEKGISVCSSNKELVEAYGPELIRIAAEHHCSYLFEASVGGGIPLLHPIMECLAQEEIQSIQGILNGTTNYILTKMERFGENYDTALKEAQELGYAEKNPEADVEGHDTGRKIAILASLMTGKTVRFADETVEGISRITPEDFACANANGYTIKLLGMAERDNGALSILTAPFLVPAGHPLFSVSDVFNGILIHGNMVDDLMFYGRGAGKNPTGSAVVSDMINAAKNIGKTIPVLWSSEVLKPEASDAMCHSFFVRADKSDREAALKAFEGQIRAEWSNEKEFVFITGAMPEGALAGKLSSLKAVLSTIRVLA